MLQWMVATINRVIAGPDLHRAGWHFGGFCKIFLPNSGKTKQKSNNFRAVPLAGTAPYYGKSSLD